MDTSFRRNDFWYRLGGRALVIISNACPPKQSQKSLRRTFESIPRIVSRVGNCNVIKGPLTYLLGLLLGKILAVYLGLLFPCIVHFIAQYLLLIYRCKYDVIGAGP